MELVIGFCAFLTVALAATAMIQSITAPRARLRSRVAAIAEGEAVGAPRGDARLLRMQRYSDLPLLQRLLQGTRYAERLADELDRAAIPLRVGEFLSLSLLAAILSAALAYLFLPAGPLRAAAALVAVLLFGLVIPNRVVRMRLGRRSARFEAELPDGLDILARSLRAGNGLLISIDALTEQLPGPTGMEFARMRQEIAAGVGVEDALLELDRRMRSSDLHIVITAFLVQREVGGNLAEILGNVAATMRERASLRQELEAQTSQQRFATWVISGAPPFILIALALMYPGFVTPMFHHTAGWIVLGIAGLLELTGVLVLRWLVSSFEV
jgi:tight adherence protein B